MSGHPYSASGAALVIRLYDEAKNITKGNYVIATIGSGGGIGLATLFQVT
ncbi:hypothetical protein [Bacillus sp. NPDC077027]